MTIGKLSPVNELSSTLAPSVITIPSNKISFPSETKITSSFLTSEQVTFLFPSSSTSHTSLSIEVKLCSRTVTDFFSDQLLSDSPSSKINIIELAVSLAPVANDTRIAAESSVSIVTCLRASSFNVSFKYPEAFHHV